MKEIIDPIKFKIKDYEIKYPTYYDLVVYVMKLENEKKQLKQWLEYQEQHTAQQNNYGRVLEKIKELDGEKDK